MILYYVSMILIFVMMIFYRVIRKEPYIELFTDIKSTLDADQVSRDLKLDISDRFQSIGYRIKGGKNIKTKYSLNIEDLAREFPESIITKNNKKYVDYRVIVNYLVKAVQENHFLIKENNNNNHKILEHIGKLKKEMVVFKQMTNNY